MAKILVFNNDTTVVFSLGFLPEFRGKGYGGVVREMIATIENRKKHPQINTLLKILKPFGYTLKIEKIK